MLWTKSVKLLYSVVISGLFVVPAIVGYALHLHISTQSFWALGAYGTVVFLFIFFQLTFATLNRITLARFYKTGPPIVSRQEYLAGCPGRPASVVGLAVVGYREEPELFRQCLDSIRRLEYPDPFKTVVVIDGNEEQDREMAEIFEKTFPGKSVVALPHVMSDTPHLNVPFPSEKESGSEGDGVTNAVCYMQPHRGKRHAMYTAFRVLIEAGCEAIMSTDSDTRFDQKAMIELERALHWHADTGAVAGDVKIWNSSESVLAYMSSLRYWMAFNIERAAQSFNRCVTCVSGPMGMYRANVLASVLDDWISQRFLRMECTYGDDRHLTNQILRRGSKVVYTHFAFCETETPPNFLRWFKQQTRWSKSFYRELLWNIRSLTKHSPWMAAELFYQGIYPFVLMFSIFYILWGHVPFVLLVWLVSLMAIAGIKTIYAFLSTASPRFLVFPFYSVYYLLGLVPAKIWALVSLWDVRWGTSARSASERKQENIFWQQVKEAMPIVVWVVLILAGVSFNVVTFYVDPERSGRQPEGASDPSSIIFFRNPEFT
ncbi:hypothetical protein DFQ28_009528 [Apophysomyces sp. BC1034]|nr:hypothetical protein DFQ30_009213 [Apophysomyces sp. BC1015]KAG0181640.1 hypothetical protein DFQ29_007626 [Apophysomyces sp. BC1021]KAG0192302.1 hypothetical protein DFQ28_009528 [Apophysomyces sp. BC1034]